MTRYLISFDHGAMDHLREEDGPASATRRSQSSRRPRTPGCGCSPGCLSRDEVSASVVAPDGTVTDGAETRTYIAGVTIIDVPSRADALMWAAKLAVAAAVHKRSASSRLSRPREADRAHGLSTAPAFGNDA